jgi:inorganic pyrophosphatase
MNPVTTLPPVDRKSGHLNVIIETPRGCRNKYSYDEKRKMFRLGSILPSGAVFPFDFGFVPSTVGEDADPLDVLVLMDEPAFCGCLVLCRLLGVIEGNQTEDGKTERNDRLIAVAANAQTHQNVKSVADLDKNLIKEIEHFFVSYNDEKGKKFKPLGCHGPATANRLVRKAQKKRK